MTGDQFDAALDKHGWRRAVEGLTQAQLDVASASRGNAPDLRGLVDPRTAQQLVWPERP